MLEEIRKQSQSTLIIILFGFIIFVFVFSFGAGSRGFREGGCGRTGVAALVNGEPVSETFFSFYYSQHLNSLRRRLESGKALKPEEKLQLRQEVLQSLVDQAILRQAAYRSGLYVTDEERNDSIRNMPAFQDEKKRFSFKLYSLFVQRYLQTTTDVFEELQREEMLARRMAEVIQDTARVLDDEIEAAYRLRETKVDIEYVKISAAKFATDTPASDEQVAQFVKEHPEEIKAEYEARSETYHKPKQVQVAHVFFEKRQGYDAEQIQEKREQAEISYDDLKKGADFAAQAKEYSEDDATREKGGELPLLTRELLAARWGTAVAEAAFALEEGALSPVIESEKGFHVLKALKVVPAEDHSLEEVQNDIARTLLRQRDANQKARAEAERILAAVKSGKKLTEVVPAAEEGKEGAPDRLVSQRSGFFSRMMPFVPGVGMNDDLVRQAFDLPRDKPFYEAVFTLGTVDGFDEYLLFGVAERKDPDMAAFAEAKPALAKQMLMMRRYQQVATWSEIQRSRARVEINQALLTIHKQKGKRAVEPIPMDDF
jgi:peptidyl-prolyl cis-trans isomerase D